MKILAAFILSVVQSVAFACGGSSPLPPVSKGDDDPAVAQVKAILVQLVELSKKQELQTAAGQKLLRGELLSLKIPTFGNLTDAPDKVVLLDQKRAVGRFQRFGANAQITDVYFYLNDENGWKVTAVRLLALTGMIEQAYLGLKAKTNLTEDEKGLLGNFKLTLAPDAELKSWFLDHKKPLDDLCVLLAARSKKSVLSVKRDDQTFPEAAGLLRKLDLSTTSVNENGEVEFVIGGVTDNTVGFLYSASKNPPKIDPSSYIWVEEVAPNWYLFRTT